MNRPSRVHWVGLQALHWPPSVHSALMLGHARNVHTYGYKHKHSGTAWKLVAGYLTFQTWKTSANIGVWSSPEKLKHWLFVGMPKMMFMIFGQGPRVDVWIMTVVCQKHRWKQCDVSITKPLREQVWMDVWVWHQIHCCLHPVYYQLWTLCYLNHDHNLPQTITKWFF